MTAKEYLSQIRTLDTIIDQKLQELSNLHDIATAIGSFDYSKDRVQTSPSGEAPYAKTAEKAAELDGEIERLVGIRLGIIRQIQDARNPNYIRILYMRFVQMKSLKDIAKEMNYSYDRAKHICSYAMRDFERRHPHTTTIYDIVYRED